MTDRFVDVDRVASDDDCPDDAPEPSEIDAVATVEEDAAPPDSAPAVGRLTVMERFHRWRRRRMARWDLPPHPKDWRYFVGGFGKILIVTGLLMFGFVAYQLWGTGIETARAQNKLRGEFEEQVEAATTVDEPAVGIENWVVPRRPIDDTPTGDATDDDTPADDVIDGVDAVDDDVAATDPPFGDEPLGEPSDIVPGGVDLTDYAVEHDVPVIAGESFALLEIPAIGQSDQVVPGVRLNDLKMGPGHYDGTPFPGQLGNAAIAGHRTTSGAPFSNLDRLETGDEIIVTMVTGDRFVYEVTGLEVVGASDSWVIGTRDKTVAELTLTTCHPKYTARDRLVVHSVLVPEKSSQVGVAEFYDRDDLDDVDEPEEPILGDDPTLVADTDDADDAVDEPPDAATPTLPAFDVAEGDGAADEPDVVAPATDDTGDAADAADSAASGDAGVEPETDTDTTGNAEDDLDEAAAGDPATSTAPPADAELDAFEQGWFDDREAFPQIALWASVLILISIIGYQLAKRFRRYWVGITVAFAPFVVALYFFYQNVNRLLPPGL